MGLRPSRPIAALALVVALGSACGTDRATEDRSEDPAPAAGSSSGAPGEPGKPDCADVWSDGAKLPDSYAGCNAEAGFVPRDRLGCSSGQVMVRYDDRFYAVLGGTIHASESSLSDDVRYRKAIASCRG